MQFGYKGVFGGSCVLISTKMIEAMVSTLKNDKSEQGEFLSQLIVELEMARDGLDRIDIKYAVSPAAIKQTALDYGYADENQLFRDYRSYGKFKKFHSESPNSSKTAEEQKAIVDLCEDVARKNGKITIDGNQVDLDVLTYNVLRLLKVRSKEFDIDAKISRLLNLLDECDLKEDLVFGIPLANIKTKSKVVSTVEGYNYESYCTKAVDFYVKSFCNQSVIDSGELKSTIGNFQDPEIIFTNSDKVKDSGKQKASLDVEADFDLYLMKMNSESVLDAIQQEFNVKVDCTNLNFHYTSEVLCSLGIVFTVFGNAYARSQIRSTSVKIDSNEVIPSDSLFYTTAKLIYLDKKSKEHYVSGGGIRES